MSTLIVEVCAIEEIKPHPNADLVELVRVKDWWCVSGKGFFTQGEKCVYFPPDCVIPEALAEKFEITKYTSPLPRNADGSRPPGVRIRAQRFRGEPSFGTVQKPDDPNWPVGMSVLEYYGVTKYEPPLKAHDGDAATPVSAFHTYTDIENIRNFPGVLVDGEEVVIDEKIHGSNCRVGMIAQPHPETGEKEWVYMAGSHGTRRKEFDDKGHPSKYWLGMTENVRKLLNDVCERTYNVVIFGELYGAGIQDMAYGLSNARNFRAFDIAVNGKYLDYDKKEALFKKYGIETAPCLYRGPFSMEMVASLTDGPTTLCPADQAGKFKGREGVVVRPVVERYDSRLPNFGRVILKSISVDYLARKGGTEFH